MLELDFNNVFSYLRFCHPSDFKLLDEYTIKLQKGNTDITVDHCWNTLLQFFTAQYPDCLEIIKTMKNDLIMSVYAISVYATTKSTTKNEIERLVSPILHSDPEVCGAELDEKCQQLRDIYYGDNNRLHWNQSRKNNDLKYFEPAWIPNASSANLLNVLDGQDYYYYLKNYKQWPFYHENQNGMPLYLWYKTISKLYKQIKTSKKKPLDEQFSYYIFEQLYSPCRFIESLNSFLTNFHDVFYNIEDPLRERAIMLSSTLADLPLETQKYYSEKYFSDLKLYLTEPAQEEISDAYKSDLYRLNMYRCYFFPLAQSIMLYLLYNACTPEDILKKSRHTLQHVYQPPNSSTPYILMCTIDEPLDPLLCFTNNLNYLLYNAHDNENKIISHIRDKIWNHISAHLQSYDYKTIIRSSLDIFKNTPYPVNEPISDTVHLLPKKIRNNVPIDSFGYNFTCFYYRHASQFNYFDRRLSGYYISPGIYSQETLNTSINSANGIHNIYTLNFVQQKNPNLIISGTIEK